MDGAGEAIEHMQKLAAAATVPSNAEAYAVASLRHAEALEKLRDVWQKGVGG
jgi:histidinol-phosphate/aromatic aminotransferase/cobyric acid decarboxylase-like protein